MVDRPNDAVYYVARTVPAYRVPILERLNERLDGRLVVCHGETPSGSSLSTIAGIPGNRLEVLRLRNHWIGGERIHAQNFLPIFSGPTRPNVLLAEESPRSLTLPLLMLAAHASHIPTVLWGHFSSNDRIFSTDNWQDRYRLTLARRACACVCYTKEIAELLQTHLPHEQVFTAVNTLDTHRLAIIYDELDAEGRQSVRTRLHLPEDELIVTYLGRLIKDKGTDRLLDVFERIASDRPARLLIIGDGEERASIEQRIEHEGMRGVRLLGSITDLKASAPYLYASDVLLLPGYVGLAVNHAFALGLPVVTHRSPGKMRYHSPEIAYIRDGVNGILADYGDVDGMARAALHIAAERERYARAALETARTDLGMEKMVDGLVAAIEFAEQNC